MSTSKMHYCLLNSWFAHDTDGTITDILTEQLSQVLIIHLSTVWSCHSKIKPNKIAQNYQAWYWIWSTTAASNHWNVLFHGVVIAMETIYLLLTISTYHPNHKDESTSWTYPTESTVRDLCYLTVFTGFLQSAKRESPPWYKVGFNRSRKMRGTVLEIFNIQKDTLASLALAMAIFSISLRWNVRFWERKKMTGELGLKD